MIESGPARGPVLTRVVCLCSYEPCTTSCG